ncbi:hypothetical protein P3S68_010674 [Capsicum galapagoense]
MMETEDKTLFCFYYWGRKNKVLPDGSISYGGGITDQVIAKTGIKYNDFVTTVFDRLGIDPSGHDENDLGSPLKKARIPSAGDSNPLKKAMVHQSVGDGNPQQKEAVGGDDQKHAGVTRSCSNSMERLINKVTSIPTSGGAKKVEFAANSDSEPDTIPDSDPPELYDYLDPEFRDFDKHKSEIYFAVDQIWACHNADFMPRLYAHIRKVSSPEFRIRLRWLEAHPEDQREHAWVREELPVGCGKFRRGSSKYTSEDLYFLIKCSAKRMRADWDIRWSRKYKYEIVEVLSEFVGDAGIQVGYLAKVAGFISLFQRTSLTLAGAFFVKQEELYKFSHRIPSKMSRTEREGVPVGSFELDPASLPLNPSDIWCPRIVEEELRTPKSEPVENVLPAFPLGTTDKFRTSLKLANLNGFPVTDGESAKVQSSSQSYRQATR